ncbi:MAG TPA: carboxypeptidase regulatory-like domain-containing protein [Vicinamibacterales bacterium]|nr:carboxypeptidase regulatory-like domain-containing protein [Vicinamibacterales bacterium]
MKQVASRGVLALLALALVAGTASAQVQTGEIFGKVTDATGGVLPGVTVTIESPALITPQTAVTAESGAYRFPNVPIAIYTVRFEITGFSRLVRSDVTIQAGFNAEINAKLEVSTVQETVTVSGESPIVDTKSTTIGTNFNKDMLEKIPSARDPWVILEQTPGMVMDRQNVGGNQSGQQSSFLAHGSSSNQIWNIDGATITDMAAGGSPTYYDFDSFEEIQIQTGGADASTEAGGVSINFVTKSGGNSFKGSGRLYVTDQRFQSDNINDELRAQGAGSGNPIQNIKEYGFEVGGPIKRSKAWFWGAYGVNDIKVGVVGFLIDPNGDPNDKNNLQTDLTEIDNYNAKVQYQWAKGHKSTFLYTRGEKIRNARGAGPLNPIETTTPQSGPSEVYKGEHQWIVNDRLLMTGQYSYVVNSFILDYHAPELATVQPLFFITSTYNARSGTQNNNIRPTYETRLDGTYFIPSFLGGDHSTKFGFRYRSTPYETTNATGGGASARVRGISRPDQVNAFLAANGRMPCSLATDTCEANIVRDGDVSRGMWEYSTYLNDSYRRGRMTLNVGVRWDYQDDAAKRANVAANPILPDLLPALSFSGADSGVTYSNISPRIGVTYDVTGRGKTVLKSNYARYYGIGIYTASTVSPTGQTTLRYRWVDANGDLTVQRNELDLSRFLTTPTSNYDPANPGSPTTPARVDPNLENDITDEVIVGVDHELMRNFGVGVSYIYRNYHNFQASYRVGATSDEYFPVTFTAACGNASCSQATYTAVAYDRPGTLPATTILRNDGQYRNYNGVEFTARKRFSNRWMAMGALTWNDTRYYWSQPTRDYLDPTNIEQQNGAQVGTLNVRWVGKLSGLYALPWNISASAFWNFRQGFPFNPTVQSPTAVNGVALRPSLGQINVQTTRNNTVRYENFSQLDIRVDKIVQLGHLRVVPMVEVFNLTNANTVLSRIARQNADNANNVSTVLSGRVIRFAGRVSF